MNYARPSKLPDEEHDRPDQEKRRSATVEPDDIHFRNIAPAIEFVCWVVVALAPFLRVINGPAVTDDQFVIQVALFSLALLGGVGLRLYQLFSQ